MRSRFLVAGAGHGGLVAAIHLARAGHDVVIIERTLKKDLGWDWHDHFKFDTLERSGLPPLPPGSYYRTANVTFSSPDLQTTITTSIPEEEREIGVERKALIEMLVSAAIEAGAGFEFGKVIEGPLIEDGIITGVRTVEEAIHADMVIDAAGVFSPVRQGLPDSFGIQQKLHDSEVFHAYRAYHELVPGQNVNGAGGSTGDPVFIIHFGFNRTRGIAWFQDHALPAPADRTGRPFADVLVGKIGPFAHGEVKSILDRLKTVHPAIGDQVLRGGHVAAIPVRRTLDKIIAPNYALVGDSACMAKPINGSGIEHAMIAGKILAMTIMNIAPDGVSGRVHYRPHVLWPYQVEYTRQIGARMVGVQIVKEFLASAPWDDIDFIFAKGLITGKDIEAATRGGDVRMGVADLLRRVARGIARPRALGALKRMVDGVQGATKIARDMPVSWDPAARDAWQSRIESRMKKALAT